MRLLLNYWTFAGGPDLRFVSDDEKAAAIIKEVSDFFKVPIPIMKSACRKREFVQARQIAMYFIREKTSLSQFRVGLGFGGRDHSTVIHACQTVNDLIDSDKKYRQNVLDIRNKIAFI